MGGGGQQYAKNGRGLSKEAILKRHRSVDGDAYVFDVEYEKLKHEKERIQREYDRERERYLRITEQLRNEMTNGTASEGDAERYMEVLSERGVQLQQQQARLQNSIDGILTDRNGIENDINELRRNAFSGSTSAYKAVDKDQEYNGFKADNRYSAKVVEMTPAEYLRRVAFGAQGMGSIQTLMQSISSSSVDKYMRQMLRGTKFATPALGEHGQSSSINNNRVVAAMMNGYGKIPVMIVDRKGNL